jgi:ribonuclease VapC
MIVDTSPIVAVIANEPDSARYRNTILGAESPAMSSVTVLETRIVLYSRYGAAAAAEFDEMLERFGFVVVPFDRELAHVAFDGFRRYGKGEGQPVQLNIVDCAAYALAKMRSEPLLDLANIDITSVF